VVEKIEWHEGEKIESKCLCWKSDKQCEVWLMRFTLETDRWYACEIIGDEFTDDKCSYSTIRVDRIKPLKQGNGTFRLDFYHANYPEGVRNKSYLLRTLYRGDTLLIAQSLEHTPIRLLQIYDIDESWIRRHFPEAKLDDQNVQDWLTKNA
jgi:hypothetical protein